MTPILSRHASWPLILDFSGIFYTIPFALTNIFSMAKGKSQYCTWYCSEKDCNRANDVTYYDRRRDDEIAKTLSKFCPNCRKHTVHKRKDTKKGSNN